MQLFTVTENTFVIHYDSVKMCDKLDFCKYRYWTGIPKVTISPKKVFIHTANSFGQILQPSVLWAVCPKGRDERKGEVGYSTCPAKSPLSRQMWAAAAAAASTCSSSAPSLAVGRITQLLRLSRTQGQGWSQAPQFSGRGTVHKWAIKLFWASNCCAMAKKSAQDRTDNLH